VSLTVGMIRIE